MKKRFCDICPAEITNDIVFELNIYDDTSEEDVLEKDMCEKCEREISKLLTNHIQSKKEKDRP